MLTKINGSERQYATIVTSKLRNALSRAIVFASYVSVSVNVHSRELFVQITRANSSHE